MKIYCPDCNDVYDEYELRIKSYQNSGDEEVCPKCDNFHDLVELEEYEFNRAGCRRFIFLFFGMIVLLIVLFLVF